MPPKVQDGLDPCGLEDALGWMFGDVGNAIFWISPRDLARRDFDKVWATVQGA